VTGYVLERTFRSWYHSAVFSRLNGQNLADNPFRFQIRLLFLRPAQLPSLSTLFACGNHGSFLMGQRVLLYRNTYDKAFLVRGPQGRNYIVTTRLPEETQSLQLSRYDLRTSPSTVTNFVVPVANLTNGVFEFRMSGRLRWGTALDGWLKLWTQATE